MSDDVNHPAHYKTAAGLEAIDVIEAFGLGFRLGNAVKYLLRAGRKTSDPTKDLQKARWYIDRELAALGDDGWEPVNQGVEFRLSELERQTNDKGNAPR